MNMNPQWTEPEPEKPTAIKEPHDVVKMRAFITAAITESRKVKGKSLTVAHVAAVITRSLTTAGYSKADPHLVGYLRQLSLTLKGFRTSLAKIIERTDLLRSTDEEAVQIQRIIDHANKKMGGGHGG